MVKTEKDISKDNGSASEPKIRMTRKRLLDNQVILFDPANPPEGLTLGQVLPEAASHFLYDNLRLTPLSLKKRKKRDDEKSGM